MEDGRLDVGVSWVCTHVSEHLRWPCLHCDVEPQGWGQKPCQVVQASWAGWVGALFLFNLIQWGRPTLFPSESPMGALLRATGWQTRSG